MIITSYIIFIRDRTFGKLLNLKYSLGRVTYGRIHAAKNVLGGISSTKSILRNVNLSSKVVQSKELNKRQHTTVTNSDNNNDNVNDKNKNKNNDNNNKYDNNNKDKIIDISIKGKQSKDPGLALSYCIAFSPDLKKCLCNVHGNHITVRTAKIITVSEFLQEKMTSYEKTMKAMANKLLSRDKDKDKDRNKDKDEDEDKDKDKHKHKDKDKDEDEDEDKKSHCARHAAVTLITVGWAHEYDEGTMDPILESWCGPKVTNTLSFIPFHFIFSNSISCCVMLFYFILF